MTHLPLTALVTLLIAMLMFGTGVNVGRARGLYGVKAPAVTGHEMFERAYRIQMNTLETAVVFLPALWIDAVFMGDKGAALGGAIWFISRVWYAVAYQRSPSSRGPAFGVSAAAFAGLWLGALWGVGRALVS